MRDELQKLRAANAVSERVTELEQILASVHVVDPPDASSNSVTFGATVTVKDKEGATETYTVVGVDELDLEPRRRQLDFPSRQGAAGRGHGPLD